MSQSITPTELMPAIESITRAEVDMQIATAKRFPRSIGQVKKDMLSFATLDQETAESCFYSLPRGGKNIQGPSVRLAEIAVACYGNLRAGVRVVEAVTHGDSPHVVLQAVCHDLEKNTCITIEKRRRIVKKKSKDFIDEDDINLAANAGSAIAFRDVVFKVVPGALIKPVYEQAKSVAIGDSKTLSERRHRALAALGKMNVSEKRILAALGRTSVDEINLEDLETLFGLHTSIKDGQTTVDEAFPEIVQNAAKSSLLKKVDTPVIAEAPAITVAHPMVVSEFLLENGLEWGDVSQILLDNGILDDIRPALSDVLPHELTGIMESREAILKMVKGGKK